MAQPADLPDVGALTRAIAAGDADAFTTLYNARFDFVYAAIRRITGLGEQDCLDITQEAMLRMIRNMRITDRPGELHSWMHCVARGAAYDFLRQERRRRLRERGAPRREEQGQAAAHERLAEIEHALARVRAALAGLDEDRAELLRLRFGRGMTLEGIGRMLGLKPGAIDGRVGRALRAAQESGDSDA